METTNTQMGEVISEAKMTEEGAFNGTAIIPNLDSIAEFRIITNNFDQSNPYASASFPGFPASFMGRAQMANGASNGILGAISEPHW